MIEDVDEDLGSRLRRGVLAASNAELVADAAELVHTLGRAVATVGEARGLLTVPTRVGSR